MLYEVITQLPVPSSEVLAETASGQVIVGSSLSTTVTVEVIEASQPSGVVAVMVKVVV